MYQRQNLPPRGKDKSGKQKLWTGPHEPIPERQRAPAVVTTATYCAATGVSLPPVAPFLAKLREQLTVTWTTPSLLTPNLRTSAFRLAHPPRYRTVRPP